MAEAAELRADFNKVNSIVKKVVSGKKKQVTPWKIRKRLKNSYDVSWKQEWLETSIKFNCFTRKEHFQTFKMMRELRKLHRTQGSDEFDSFFGDINKMMHPEALTPHGYMRPLANQDAAVLTKGVNAALKPLEAMGLPCFLYAGGLLGLVRDGRFIGHDDDIDIAVYLGDMTLKQAAVVWRELKVELVRMGLVVAGDASANAPVFKLITELDVEIDLFACWSNGEKLSLHPFSINDLRKDDVFPLRRFEIEGCDEGIAIPAKPEALLHGNYGESWRIPDPLFYFNWREATKRFQVLYDQEYI